MAARSTTKAARPAEDDVEVEAPSIYAEAAAAAEDDLDPDAGLDTDEEPAEKPDVEVILPDLDEPIMVAGVPCDVVPLKLGQFLSLVQVITTGMGYGMRTLDIDTSDPATAARDLGMLLMVSVGNAPQELSIFLAKVVRPVDNTQENRAKVGSHLHDLDESTEIEEFAEICERIALQEAENMVSLGNRLRAMGRRIGATYRAK